MLSDHEYQALDWTPSNASFHYEGLVRIGTIGDGSCYFHAIAKSFFTPYKLGKLDGTVLNRSEFIRKLRKDLANKLSEPVDSANQQNVRYYDLLSRGKLGELSRGLPQLSLENMKKLLDSSLSVDNRFNEFVSNVLNKDIYLLDFLKKDVYVTGDDADILYKGRDSIILLTMPGHYELVGLTTEQGIQTLFPSNHPLIRKIRDRISYLIVTGSRS